MDVLIFEDEKKAARELELILKQLDPTIRVVAILESVEYALTWLNTHPQPDLIFSDIQLADGLCFDIYRQTKVRSPVIFCTAFDDYLLTAFDTNAVSYLLKPITPEKVKQALDKFQSMEQAFARERASVPLELLLQQLQPNYRSSVLVNQKERIIPVRAEDIAFIYVDNTQLKLTTLGNQQYSVPFALDPLEGSLDPKTFYRANRQFLINRHAVQSIERFFARKLIVKLTVTTPGPVVISKAGSVSFLRWLENGS